MFELLKKEIKISDLVKLYLISGKEVEGVVIELGDDNVQISTSDGSNIRLFDKLIGGWQFISTIDYNKNGNESSYLLAKGAPSLSSHKESITEASLKSESISRDNSKKEKKANQTFSVGFEGKYKLEEFTSKLMESENEKTVPAIGTIMKHSESREYGFIKNAFGEDVFFHYNNIIEPDLRDQLKGEKQFLNIQVCYTESRNIKGKKAVSLHLPWKVSKCLEIADTLKCNGNYEEAADICKQILFAFPENVLAMKRLEALRPKRKYFAKAESSVEFLYLRGKKAKDNKDYVNAISLLKESIKKGEKLDSAVKDLASCYQELGDYESGISLIKDQITNLQKNDTTYNFVANFYSAAGLFELSNEYLDKILLNIPSSQKVPVLFRKSQNLLKLKSYDNALTIFEDVLSIDPENSFALKWRDQINKYKSDGDEEIVRPTDDLEFLTTLSGATTIILSDLKQCKYEGIPDEVVLKSEFKKEDLEKLRMRLKVLTNEGGSNLPSERAKWLLTEIKLVKDHQLDGEETLNALMSRYCIAKAQSYAINNDSEMIRTYYLELFKINKNMRYIVQPLLLSVLSFSKNWEWINNSKYTQGIDAARIKEFRATGLRDVIEIHKLSQEGFDKVIDYLLYCSLFNSTISAFVFNEFMENVNFKHEFRSFLESFGFEKEINVDSWRMLLELKSKEQRLLVAKCKQICSQSSLDSILINATNALKDIQCSATTSIDKMRCVAFEEIIHEALKFSSRSFEAKENSYSLTKTLAGNLKDEILNRPTPYSIESLLPIVDSIVSTFKLSFKKALESSKPEVTLTVLGDQRFLDDNNKVIVQLSIKNSTGCSPIRVNKVKVAESVGLKLDGEPAIPSEMIRGGDERIATIPLIVSSPVFSDKAATMKVGVDYISTAGVDFANKEMEEIQSTEYQKLALRFYSKEQFKQIRNPYSAIADSGPVKDSEMFFGRQNIINEIANSLLHSSSNKFIDIYGQKRSGKSSLLYHLKNRIDETGNFVCIYFTLGLMTTYDSASFYYMILKNIEEYIENHEDAIENKPRFIVPRISELSHNPSILFDESIRLLVKQFKAFNNWKSKRLLLLIDELTYLYTAYLRKQLDREFMKSWKAMLENGLFSAIVVGQDVMPKFKSLFANEFGVFEDRRLTYLNYEDAKELIEKPVWDLESNSSRFIGKAIERIVDYTSLNPYYLQIFCARLIDIMNSKKLIKVTEADVDEVANSFVEGENSLPSDKFDNLINAGDADLELIPQNHTLEILRQIANNSKVLGSCHRDSILFKDRIYDEQILSDLLRREVISCRNSVYYRIQVQIFNNWLLKH